MPPIVFKPDLHCHSHFSDGKHSPSFLFTRAVETGVSHLAITDHDYITQIAQEESISSKLQIITGVEISCAWGSLEIHIVGLFIDPNNSALNDLLIDQRAKRKQRTISMDEKLNAIGIEGLIDHFELLPCESRTRSHVAEFLVSNGHCKNWDKAFKKFLSRRGQIHVPIEWASLDQVVTLIANAGGISVIAHPGRYGLTRTKLEKLIAEFKAAGGDAIEGSYGNIDAITRKYLCETASNHNLYISLGSDFHSADRQWTNLGKFPGIEKASTKNAIWNHPRWHF